MNKNNDRLRQWTEQGNVTIPQLFFKHYKQLNILDDEALLLLHLMAFHAEQNDFPTPTDLAMRLHLNETEVTIKLQSLLQKGFLEITQGTDQHGRISEKYSLFPLWDRILDLLDKSKLDEQIQEKKNEEGEIFTLFEQEFGRLFSPMEIETISMWMDVDGHSPTIIKQALKEAVLAGKLSLRYIDRILFEWKKKNIKTVQQVEKHTEQFHQKTTMTYQRNHTQENTAKVPFYNWLEERE